jgi:hypothetical protein
MEFDMRKRIAGMTISVDGKIEGPEGYAYWVEASEDYGLTQQIDACVVGSIPRQQSRVHHLPDPVGIFRQSNPEYHLLQQNGFLKEDS